MENKSKETLGAALIQTGKPALIRVAERLINEDANSSNDHTEFSNHVNSD
ncbi:MAG: hypothetical protein IPK88_20190 [Saprospiraceae bacterium]|nr:hypothetical protein [Candidatus Defluviibacterium haderslevense]MBK8245758.1 hypothetical protein [Candidatus Defluviibacterium haderslevense]